MLSSAGDIIKNTHSVLPLPAIGFIGQGRAQAPMFLSTLYLFQWAAQVETPEYE